MTLFEMSSGCKMHRTAISQKCKLLALGKWKRTLKQEHIPHNFFLLSDHMDFLGVILQSSYSFTRKANGDLLQERIKKVVGPWRAGRFMCLTLRPHSINLYAFMPLYRCNSIDLRIADIKLFSKTAKSFLYADLLEKPGQLTLFRDIEQGDLGLICIQTRATASLISTFLQTAVNPKFDRNHYHNLLFRRFVLDENVSTPKIPQYFMGDFFPNIRRMNDSDINLEQISLKGIYDYLMSDMLRTETQILPNAVPSPRVDWPLTPLKCELKYPNTDWPRAWRLARQDSEAWGLTLHPSPKPFSGVYCPLGPDSTGSCLEHYCLLTVPSAA